MTKPPSGWLVLKWPRLAGYEVATDSSARPLGSARIILPVQRPDSSFESSLSPLESAWFGFGFEIANASRRSRGSKYGALERKRQIQRILQATGSLNRPPVRSIQYGDSESSESLTSNTSTPSSITSPLRFLSRSVWMISCILLRAPLMVKPWSYSKSRIRRIINTSWCW